MNLIDLFEETRKTHAKELRELVANLAKDLLSSTEGIPKEELQELFRHKKITTDFYMESSSKGYLDICASYINYDVRKKNLPEIPHLSEKPWTTEFDDTAVEKLAEFIKKYYPTMSLSNFYWLDVRKKTIELKFSCDVKFDVEDFVKKGEMYILKSDADIVKRSVGIVKNNFDEDMAEAFPECYNGAGWMNLNKFYIKKETDWTEIETDSYCTGVMPVKFKIESLL